MKADSKLLLDNEPRGYCGFLLLSVRGRTAAELPTQGSCSYPPRPSACAPACPESTRVRGQEKHRGERLHGARTAPATGDAGGEGL